MTLKSLLAGAALAAVTVGAASATTISSGPPTGSISAFGAGATPTYGEVFTAPVSGKLTSFTLSLDGAVGSLEGAVGTWNGGATYSLGNGSPVTLFQSAPQASTGAQSFTFSPNVAVVAGHQYVAFLSTFGDPNANAGTSMPGNYFGGSNLTPFVDYFVFNNGGNPYGNASWDYFANFGTAQFTATFSVPEPATWALMLVGVGGLGASLRSRRKAVLAA